MLIPVLLLCVGSYVLGSISFAWLVGRWHGLDLRLHGSGNLGATNAGRVLGRRWFFVVFAADVAKGALAALAGWWLTHRLGLPAEGPMAQIVPVLASAAVVIGHAFTCFHRFRGGKAVATTLGVFIGLFPWLALVAFSTWFVLWLAFSLLLRWPRSEAVGPASVLAALSAPFWNWSLTPQAWSSGLPRMLFIIVTAILVVVLHRSNMVKTWRRLRGLPTTPAEPKP